MIRLEKLTLDNFKDFETLTCNENEGGCYCSFWHQKWTSRADWDLQCKKAPEKNKETVMQKVESGFHLGALAYESEKLVGWISVGPITDFFWSWKRVAQVGADSATVAGIVCITIHPDFRRQGVQTKILVALKEYGATQGWKRIEGYPFDQSAREKHGAGVLWPGLTEAFVEAGYQRTEPHWLNNSEAERSIFAISI